MIEPKIRPIRMADGAEISFRYWYAGSGKPKGLVLYLHGIQSHGDWYLASSRRLAEASFAVYQPERRGSGLNRENRGHVDSYKTWLSDAMALVAQAKQEHPGVAVHCLAVSWGGKLAVALAKAYPEAFAGLALVAPGIFPRVDVGLWTKLKVAAAMTTRQDHKLLPVPLADARLFTANPERIRYIETDELSLRHVTARFMYESRRLDSYIRDAGKYISAPVFLALAAKDRITDNRATARYIETFRSPIKRIKTYDGAHHTLEFEPDPRAYFEDLVAWMNERAGESEDTSQISSEDASQARRCF